MTTAHRPTWYNAIGGDNQGGNRKVSQTVKVCSRDMPSHTQMKTRDLTDYVKDKNVIKNNLIQLENNSNNNKLLAIENIKKITNQEYTNPFPEDEDEEIGGCFKASKKKNANKNLRKKKFKFNDYGQKEGLSNQEDEGPYDNNDSDDENHDYSGENGDSDSDSQQNEESEETDDEEKELLRELEILKKEKEEKLKKEAEQEEMLKNKKNNVLTNNPLINLEDNSDNENSEKDTKKRKWTDDAIFRNTCEKKEKNISFINDTVRSAFHKKFLFKYIH